jgi:hypothetical protein
VSIEMKKFEGFHIVCGSETAFYTKDGTPIFTVKPSEEWPDLDPMAAAPLSDDVIYRHLRLLAGAKDQDTKNAHAIPIMNHIKWQDGQISRLELEARFNKSIANAIPAPMPERPSHLAQTIAEMSK